MTRPMTPVMSQFVVPIASQLSTRATVSGVIVGILTAVTGYSFYELFHAIGHVGIRGQGVAVAICGAMAAWSVLRFRLASRAKRVLQRSYTADARFMFDTKCVGEVGPDGQIMKDVSIPITAEQFTHMLSMPRPQMAFQAPLPGARVNR